MLIVNQKCRWQVFLFFFIVYFLWDAIDNVKIPTLTFGWPKYWDFTGLTFECCSMPPSPWLFVPMLAEAAVK